MKEMLFILLPIILLAACASQPLSIYRPAKASGYGYMEKSLGENHYSVEFTIAGSNVKRAEDYALLRAAELTTSQGYDWFEIKKRYHHDNNVNKNNGKFDSFEPAARQRISRDCGLLGCRTQVHTNADRDLESEAPFPETTAVLEISFGKGVRPAKQNIYDAIETIENLRAKMSSGQ